MLLSITLPPGLSPDDSLLWAVRGVGTCTTSFLVGLGAGGQGLVSWLPEKLDQPRIVAARDISSPSLSSRPAMW